jgi:hypothetical protein
LGDCTDCKWWMSIDGYCLLGRAVEHCGNNPARRGDDELVDRLLELPEGEREELGRRLGRANRDIRDIGSGRQTE